MTRLLLLITIAFFTSSLRGQVIETRIQEKVNVLKLSGIDTFFIYSFSCNGGLIPFDTCALEETQYLIWIQNSKTFLERFNYCKDYKRIELDTINPLTYYLENKRIIDKEEIKPPTYYQIKKTKKGFDTLVNSLMVDHSCYHQFNFFLNNKSTEKSVSIFNLDFVRFDNGRRNIYINYNQRTKLNALILQISELVKKLDVDKKFETQ